MYWGGISNLGCSFVYYYSLLLDPCKSEDSVCCTFTASYYTGSTTGGALNVLTGSATMEGAGY